MIRQIYSKLQWLQILDAIFLICLLSFMSLLIWNSLGNLSDRVHHSLLESNQILTEANSSITRQLDLKAAIDAHRDTFDQLNEAFFKFAFAPQGSPDNSPQLLTLGQKLDEQCNNLLTIWPQKILPDLLERYEESIGAMIRLTTEVPGFPPSSRRQLAADARDTLREARMIMRELEDLDDQLGANVMEAIYLSIENNTSNMTRLENEPGIIKRNTLSATLVITILLLGMRLFFSSRFRKIAEEAQRAQTVAEDALATKARFLATMSHEIRTPLNGVIGMTHLLMKTPMSKKQTEFVESISLSSDHLLTVINDVLDFSKIEAGKLDIKNDPLEIRACIEDVLNLLHSKALEKDLELAYSVDASVPLFIEGDMVRLRQVLTNLIGNAIKFTDSGEITVFVTPRDHQHHDWELEFQINDTGAGIPPERLESIFEQFSQADNSLARQHEGTGLGLTISRHLVEMMGGRIWAASTPGVGSRFHFTIRTRETEGALKPFLHTNIPEITGKHILIVENNPASSQALRDFCQGWGATADTASSSSEAMGWLAAGRAYDIALVDSNLPATTPIDFARYVRQRYSKQELPLILVAPPNDRHPRDQVRELFNLYLTKPITRSRLFDSLMTVLGELEMVTVRPETSALKPGERLPLSILLAEDNPINQVVASSILGDMAYQADLAENGLEAIAALRKKAYDVIFMDMQMPEMDGLEATRQIRATFPPSQQPVIIAMTANAMEGDKQSCLDAGMNDYVSKPILPAVVEAALLRCCQPADATANQKIMKQDTQENNHATVSH